MTKEILQEIIPSIETNKDLLILLNGVKKELYGNSCHPFSLKLLTYYCNPSRARDSYKQFKIPKKSGGFREISAPKKSLKSIQTCLNFIFQTLYEPSTVAKGFLPGMSVVDNASIHTGMNYVFNTDIKDFFPSIPQARVWAVLQLPPFNFKREIANVVAGLCCMKVLNDKDSQDPKVRYKYVLPQGSPASPILTNIICQKLDKRLLGLAKRFNLRCSRYADDITFSSMHNVYQKDGAFMKELRRIVEDQHFTINEGKTRVQGKGGRREVTGLVVSDKVNVTRQYTREINSILYIWEHYGYESAFARFSHYYHQNKPCNTVTGGNFLKSVLMGKLMYMKMVKGEDDPVFSRLYSRFNRLCPPQGSGKMESNTCELSYTISNYEKEYGEEVVFKKKEDETTKEIRVYGLSKFQNKNIFIVLSKKCMAEFSSVLSGNTAVSLEQLKNKFFLGLFRKPDGNSFWMIIGWNPKKKTRTKPVIEEVTGLVEPESVVADGSSIDYSNDDDVLKKLISSDCDLSILRQWDKTKKT